MKRKEKRALILVAAIFLSALAVIFFPAFRRGAMLNFPLSIIDTETPLAGDFTIGDFLTIFSLLSGSVSIGLFLLIFWERK